MCSYHIQLQYTLTLHSYHMQVPYTVTIYSYHIHLQCSYHMRFPCIVTIYLVHSIYSYNIQTIYGYNTQLPYAVTIHSYPLPVVTISGAKTDSILKGFKLSSSDKYLSIFSPPFIVLPSRAFTAVSCCGGGGVVPALNEFARDLSLTRVFY